ncbi:50S ribosomal protein L4 [Pelagibacterium lacus]|uniref:Large ribosomal subunit protein uL4 n=1 Tax=Pelagibacterium lacus TaxID=2282655 RepID=A0A369W5A6_9HYPH|nr:50S ribosomal protein L4 [Pelagibacterium lacus]RDE09748.1 50S ribosomal protein L4 [Pelagibacterium lacus]
MELQVTTLEGKSAGKVTLDEAVFGLEPRADLIQRMVRYQLLKRMAGTHDVKNRAEVAMTGKKFGRQKGGGGARHGSRRSNIFRGGGRAFGPTPRSHAIELPKKVRALALKHALSAKAKAGDLVILDKAVADAPKTAALREVFGKLGFANALIIGGTELDRNFALAARNIPSIDVLPAQGINVYDILRREKLVLTKDALEALEGRFQ